MFNLYSICYYYLSYITYFTEKKGITSDEIKKKGNDLYFHGFYIIWDSEKAVVSDKDALVQKYFVRVSGAVDLAKKDIADALQKG